MSTAGPGLVKNLFPDEVAAACAERGVGLPDDDAPPWTASA